MTSPSPRTELAELIECAAGIAHPGSELARLIKKTRAALREADEARGLDVERLARAIETFESGGSLLARDLAERIAAEYARLGASE
jgi:predicted  nucleic acid-binding Zn-ribbon protein